jgi:hypothetical protein
MKQSRSGLALAISISLVAMPSMLQGQWGVMIEAQRAGFGGTSRDTSTDGIAGSFRPGGTLGLTVRLDRKVHRVTLGLGLRYVRSAVVLHTPDLFIGLRDDFAALEAAPEIRVRIARTSAGATFHLYGGPVLGVWTFSDLGTRAVPGAIAGVAGEFPLFERWAIWFRAGAGITRSVFRNGELPPEFERHATRRSEISLGLRYGR